MTTFIVRVPEAERIVGSLRRSFDPSAVLGVPAHITLLMPFIEPTGITGAILATASEALRRTSAFDFSFSGIGRWPETTYLIPTPAEPFIQLTQSLVEVFPAFPPYEGRHGEIAPHLTVADRSATAADAAHARLQEFLTEIRALACRAREVELLENSLGHWRTMHVVPLAERGI